MYFVMYDRDDSDNIISVEAEDRAGAIEISNEFEDDIYWIAYVSFESFDNLVAVFPTARECKLLGMTVNI